jgi:UDP-glucose 4-epimerase
MVMYLVPDKRPKVKAADVAVFMERIQKGIPLTIHGDGEQTRDFVYVKDVVRANLAAMKRGDQQIIHVSTANRTSINDLARLLTEFHGTDLPLIHSLARKGDIKHAAWTIKKHLNVWFGSLGMIFAHD